MDHCTMFTSWSRQLCFFPSPAFSITCSPSPALCDTQIHLAHYTPFTTTPITHSYCWSTLPNFLLCCLPGTQSILLAIFLTFMLAPLPESEEKMFPEKRIIIICGSALESNVLESWSNYRLWQMGPAASTLPLRSPKGPTDKCRGVTTYTNSLTHTATEAPWGVKSQH